MGNQLRISMWPLFLALSTFACCGCGGGREIASTATQLTSNQWTWVSGSSAGDASGVWGVKGITANNNVPSARTWSASSRDHAGNLWLFGGNTWVDSIGNYGEINDLWKFNLTSELWTWVGGSSTVASPGSYGAKGVASSSNVPSAREAATGWTDSSGNFWLFGGIGYDASGYAADMNDLWKYDPTSGEWTWMGGSSTNSLFALLPGTYGTQGIASATNLPGARDSATGSTDSSGNLWLFGGYGYDSNGSFGALNDLWKYSSVRLEVEQNQLVCGEAIFDFVEFLAEGA